MSTAKDHLTKLIQSQPEDSSEDDIVRDLAFDVMIRRGLADADAKRTLSNEEMDRRIRSTLRSPEDRQCQPSPHRIRRLG